MMDDGLYDEMNEVIPNLWLGSLRNARNTGLLTSKNIRSVLTAMRGRVTVSETFKRYQIELDDTDEEDVLKHLVTAITFIQTELDNGRGVLVHCLAGISRSVTIVAAYLMYAKGLDPAAALALIRKARPFVDPNLNFLSQLEIFHQASYNVSKHDKGVRMFYLEKMVKEITNGDGTVDSEMLPDFPRIATASHPPTPGGPRRRIRCKMCRTELASRENMLDHGQLGPPTPAVSFSPIAPTPPILEQPLSKGPMTEEELKLSPAQVDEAEELGRQMSRSISSTDLKQEDPPVATDKAKAPSGTSAESSAASDNSSRPSMTSSASSRSPVTSPPRKSLPSTSGLVHPSDLAAQLYANPQIAALRDGLSIVPQPSLSLSPPINPLAQFNPPTLINSKCSGYFVEPMKWMEPFLEQGQLAGKIFCPNKKCNTKLGNYDWAGVCCSCKEWIIPGFCIHRSKVDEII